MDRDKDRERTRNRDQPSGMPTDKSADTEGRTRLRFSRGWRLLELLLSYDTHAVSLPDEYSCLGQLPSEASDVARLGGATSLSSKFEDVSDASTLSVAMPPAGITRGTTTKHHVMICDIETDLDQRGLTTARTDNSRHFHHDFPTTAGSLCSGNSRIDTNVQQLEEMLNNFWRGYRITAVDTSATKATRLKPA
jgi:hypothetical protein